MEEAQNPELADEVSREAMNVFDCPFKTPLRPSNNVEESKKVYIDSFVMKSIKGAAVNVIK